MKLCSSVYEIVVRLLKEYVYGNWTIPEQFWNFTRLVPENLIKFNSHTSFPPRLYRSEKKHSFTYSLFGNKGHLFYFLQLIHWVYRNICIQINIYCICCVNFFNNAATSLFHYSEKTYRQDKIRAWYKIWSKTLT